jgi:hypothetical protein
MKRAIETAEELAELRALEKEQQVAGSASCLSRGRESGSIRKAITDPPNLAFNTSTALFAPRIRKLSLARVGACPKIHLRKQETSLVIPRTLVALMRAAGVKLPVPRELRRPRVPSDLLGRCRILFVP